MESAIGLFPGDIAVVDRARTAVDGSIVLALLAGEFTVKRYRKKGARTWLQAENPAKRHKPGSRRPNKRHGDDLARECPCRSSPVPRRSSLSRKQAKGIVYP
jgi:hypothetical protein